MSTKEIIKKTFVVPFAVVLMAALLSCATNAANTAQVRDDPGDTLRFNPDQGSEEKTLTFLDGTILKYRAYENIYYVANVVDPEYQFLNFYVPESVYNDNGRAPIFLKTNVGGYLASKASSSSMAIDASGRALQEGYVVVIAGSRGWDSKITASGGKTVFTGRAPAGLIDLKAAIRYLRHNDNRMPGSAERIITDGTSAGGALSALLGATGNNPVYEPYLQELGAAKERDDIFAAVCFCPIIDLEHADMAYEWLYSITNTGIRKLSPAQAAISNELAARYPSYIDSLGLKTPDGKPLTGANYQDYLKSFLIQSAQKAKDVGAAIPADIGIAMNIMVTPWASVPGNFVLGVELETYLSYIAGVRQLKTPPAFDQLGVLVPEASYENNVFGNETGNAVNFTEFSAQKAAGNSAALDPGIIQNVYLMNPMNFIGDGASSTTQNWYIRHGAIDRDTSFPVPINLYTKLVNLNYNVDFEIAWNRGHVGDYDLNGLFAWIDSVLKAVDKK
jgi:hypothetical protein